MIRLQETLRLTDPQQILKRGFSLTLKDGKVIRSAKQVKEGDLIETRLADGTLESTIQNMNPQLVTRNP